jgi:hypothetical protein
MLSGLKTDGPLTFPQLRFDCRNTLAGLTGTGIACPPVGAELLKTYFAHFIQSRYVQPPPGREAP